MIEPMSMRVYSSVEAKGLAMLIDHNADQKDYAYFAIFVRK